MASQYELSLKVAQPLMDLLARQPPGTEIVASGTSCRRQIEHLAPVRARHMAEVLAKQPRPKGPRLCIVTNAGGPGVLATDALLTLRAAVGQSVTLTATVTKMASGVPSAATAGRRRTWSGASKPWPSASKPPETPVLWPRTQPACPSIAPDASYGRVIRSSPPM